MSGNWPTGGWPVILSHGFPYGPHVYDEVAPRLLDAGARMIVPYPRSVGPTRFLSETLMRSGQRSALGKHNIDLLDTLVIERTILAGCDCAAQHPVSLQPCGQTGWLD